MKIHLERKNDTNAIVEVSSDAAELEAIRSKIVAKLAKKVKVAGFRAGKVPLAVAEKHLDPQVLQNEFLDEAINIMYVAILKEETIRPVAPPKVDVVKFVPFTTLELKFDIAVIGKITMPDYHKITVKRDVRKVKKEDIERVIANLQQRLAEKKDVTRAAKLQDEAMIDFTGKDAKGESISGADGNDYPLQLGSGSFIPGFEDEVVGMKIGDTKEFKITFPKDYGAAHLQNAKVTFKVTLKALKEMVLPEVNDAFAQQIGPFTTVEELRGDIKKQLEEEQSQLIERDYEAALLNELVEKTKVALPDSIVDEQKEVILQELRQNIVQRGMTYEEYLKTQNTTEEAYIKKDVIPEAIRRIKAGLVLSEIADKEGIAISDEELAVRMAQLKAQYSDAQMQAELNKEENKRDIRARMRSEKVLAFLKK